MTDDVAFLERRGVTWMVVVVAAVAALLLLGVARQTLAGIGVALTAQ